MTEQVARRIIINAFCLEPDEESAINKCLQKLSCASYVHTQNAGRPIVRHWVRWSFYADTWDSLSCRMQRERCEYEVLNHFRLLTYSKLRYAINEICSKYDADDIDSAEKEIRKIESLEYMSHDGEPFTTRIYVFQLPNYDRLEIWYDYANHMIFKDRITDMFGNER